MIEDNKLNGLSGWLTLFTVCWLYTLTIIPIGLYETYQKIDTKLYINQDERTASILGLIFGVFLTIDLLESTTKYFRRKAIAPSSIVWSLAGIGIYFSVGYLSDYYISTGGDYFRSIGGLFMIYSPGYSSAAVAAYVDIIFSLGWIIYFKSSSRVKNTFTTP